MTDMLNWVEIIKLRTSDQRFNSLKSEIVKSVYQPDRPRDLERLILFHHAAWETDWSIHLHWKTGKARVHASPQGQGLMSTLGEFGRVNHAIWVEDMIIPGPSPKPPHWK